MNGYGAAAVFFIACFGSMAYTKHTDSQIQISKQTTLQECYKAAQKNPQLVCVKAQ